MCMHSEVGSNEVVLLSLRNEVLFSVLCTLLSTYFHEYFLLLLRYILGQVSVLLRRYFFRTAALLWSRNRDSSGEMSSLSHTHTSPKQPCRHAALRYWASLWVLSHKVEGLRLWGVRNWALERCSCSLLSLFVVPILNRSLCRIASIGLAPWSEPSLRNSVYRLLAPSPGCRTWTAKLKQTGADREFLSYLWFGGYPIELSKCIFHNSGT